MKKIILILLIGFYTIPSYAAPIVTCKATIIAKADMSDPLYGALPPYKVYSAKSTSAGLMEAIEDAFDKIEDGSLRNRCLFDDSYSSENLPPWSTKWNIANLECYYSCGSVLVPAIVEVIKAIP